ncbi:ribosome-recycling factor [Alphaproteobacteria bacterium]|nr:ribosome-recycling factor [Alphaproteobacteria bacterium]
MINQLTDKLRKKMDETIQSLKRDMDSISTGRANPNLLDAIRVEIYGSMMPISQLANISVPEATTLLIQAWDKESVKSIEKAILNANLGFNPMSEGTTIRIAIPKLSEERRKDLAKLAKKYGEDKKVALRNIRRDILDEFKKNEKELGKDQAHSFNDIVQKITDEFVTKVDEMVTLKEKDLMKV